MSGAELSSPEAAADSKHAQELNHLRQQVSADTSIERQLRLGGEPGLLGAAGIDDQTLLRWLRAEKWVELKALAVELDRAADNTASCSLSQIQRG